jgi:hypothetical protein
MKAGAAVAMLSALAFGGSALASPDAKAHVARSHVQRAALHTVRAHSAGEDPSNSEQQREGGSAAESDSDAGAQAAACQKAGIDPNASNVQYDDQTGTCSLDTGSGANN